MKIAGFDEVGRGAWAGPLCVVGVVMDDGHFHGLKDSKSYSCLKRRKLSQQLLKSALYVTVYWQSNQAIDQKGLSTCLREAFVSSADGLVADRYIVDGSINYLEDIKQAHAEPRADSSYPVVAAASIIAKVARDAYMNSYHKLDNRYQFDRHVGYGTRLHREALRMYGPGKLHRRSFKGVVA